MTEIEIICKGCRKIGSLARLVDTVRPSGKGDKSDGYLQYNNAYLCWQKGQRLWWEVETKTVVGICPKCLKKG